MLSHNVRHKIFKKLAYRLYFTGLLVRNLCVANGLGLVYFAEFRSVAIF